MELYKAFYAQNVKKTMFATTWEQTSKASEKLYTAKARGCPYCWIIFYELIVIFLYTPLSTGSMQNQWRL